MRLVQIGDGGVEQGQLLLVVLAADRLEARPVGDEARPGGSESAGENVASDAPRAPIAAATA